MKLILDEWIVREVIDTLYMARTTLLGITGLDSPEEVAKKSANETAITRRISKAIDIIQQSGQLPVPNDLEEAARKYQEGVPVDTTIHYCGADEDVYFANRIVDAVIFGAKWQKEQMEKEAVEGVVYRYESYQRIATAIVVDINRELLGNKVRIIIVKED